MVLSDAGSWHPVREIFDNGDIEPVYNLHVQDHRTYFLGETSWGFSVLVHNQSDGSVHASAKEKFTEGTGPVKIVGIVGRTDVPDTPNEIGGNADLDQSRFVRNLKAIKGAFDRVAKSKKGQRGAGIHFYGSSEGTPLQTPFGNFALPESTSVDTIANALADEIVKAAKDGQLAGENIYRLLLAGYSWGGEKAILVANKLQEILPGRIATELGGLDPQSQAAMNLQEFEGHWQEKVRVYLATEDAVKIDPVKGGPSMEAPKPGAVYDHFNVFESDDTAIGLRGASFPGLGAKNNLDKTTPKPNDDAEKHLNIPGLAQKDLLEWLGLSK
jgi:hypothetical protein